MPQISGRTSVAPGATVNVLSGRVFERVGGRGAAIRAYLSGLTAGSAADILATFISGSDIITFESSGIRDGVEGLQIPEDQIASGNGLPGDQLVLNISNANAAARVVTWRVDIENL